VTPTRPLWPALSVIRALHASHPKNPLIDRISTVYGIYSLRPHVFAPIIKHLPPGERLIAFLGNRDDPSASLWLPFGSRQVVDFTPENESRLFAGHPRNLLVASRTGIVLRFGESAEDWIRERDARIIAKESLLIKTHPGPDDWFLLEMPASAAGNLNPQIGN
jgi:hypothetical protein